MDFPQNIRKLLPRLHPRQSQPPNSSQKLNCVQNIRTNPRAVEPHATPCFCRFCGASLRSNGQFCEHCGQAISLQCYPDACFKRICNAAQLNFKGLFPICPDAQGRYQTSKRGVHPPWTEKLEDLAASGFPSADSALALCLTGFRTREFLTLTRFSCDPANHALRGSSKTEAGKDRIVPVHPKLQPYNNWRFQENNPYDCLICNRYAKASKDKTCWKVLIFAYFLFSSPILSFFVHTAMNKLMILWTITYGKARCHPL